MAAFHVRKCQNSDCGLRYPIKDDYTFKERCPRCGGVTLSVVEYRSGAEELPASADAPRKRQIEVAALLDNVRSAWNVGSIIRSADGAGFSHLYLCGITPTPEYPATLKTSLGAEQNLIWSQHLDGFQAGKDLVQGGYRLWALENDPDAVILYELESVFVNAGDNRPIVLLVGNEVAGVDPELLGLCEHVLYLPMHGIKRSYNVAVAFGIAAHYLGWLNSG